MGFRTIITCDNCERELGQTEEYAVVEVKSEVDGPIIGSSRTDRASAVWCMGCHGGRWPGIKNIVRPG